MVVDIEGYYTGGGGQFNPTTPTRVADTRTGSGYPYAGQTIAASHTLNVQITGANGDGVPAVVLNVTEVNATANGLFTVYPTGQNLPNTTTVAFPANTVVGNEVTVGLGTGGAITIYSGYGTADGIVDVEGYYAPGTSQFTATYTYNGDGLGPPKRPTACSNA